MTAAQSADVRVSFEFLFPRLLPGGLYCIEDLGTSYSPDYGGSVDLNDPTTSVALLKTLPDNLNSFAFKHPYLRPQGSDPPVLSPGNG